MEITTKKENEIKDIYTVLGGEITGWDEKEVIQDIMNYQGEKNNCTYFIGLNPEENENPKYCLISEDWGSAVALFVRYDDILGGATRKDVELGLSNVAMDSTGFFEKGVYEFGEINGIMFGSKEDAEHYIITDDIRSF